MTFLEAALQLAGEEWRDRAACRGMDPDLFHPVSGDDVVLAQAVCLGCSVTGECLDFALANGMSTGVWGGRSERQRRRLRHEAAKPLDLDEFLFPVDVFDPDDEGEGDDE